MVAPSESLTRRSKHLRRLLQIKTRNQKQKESTKDLGLATCDWGRTEAEKSWAFKKKIYPQNFFFSLPSFLTSFPSSNFASLSLQNEIRVEDYDMKTLVGLSSLTLQLVDLGMRESNRGNGQFQEKRGFLRSPMASGVQYIHASTPSAAVNYVSWG